MNDPQCCVSRLLPSLGYLRFKLQACEFFLPALLCLTGNQKKLLREGWREKLRVSSCGV